jgi:hypothetical protein
MNPSLIAAGCPILNFAFFAKFRVGTVGGWHTMQQALRHGGDRVGMDGTKTRTSGSKTPSGCRTAGATRVPLIIVIAKS